jgi:hypothetical protein
MTELPTGTITFVFTDIEGSTRLLRELSSRYAAVLERHHALIRAAVNHHGGTEIRTEGDAFFCVFSTAPDGLATSLALGNLAEAAARTGDVDRARVGYPDSIKASYALNSTHRTVEATSLSAIFEMSVDEPAHAITLFDDAIDLARSDALPFWDDFCLAMRALASHDLGESEARDRFMEHATKLSADTEFQATEDHSADDIWDAATSLQSSILMVLGIDEYGKYVGREALGLE